MTPLDTALRRFPFLLALARHGDEAAVVLFIERRYADIVDEFRKEMAR